MSNADIDVGTNIWCWLPAGVNHCCSLIAHGVTCCCLPVPPARCSGAAALSITFMGESPMEPPLPRHCVAVSPEPSCGTAPPAGPMPSAGWQDGQRESPSSAVRTVFRRVSISCCCSASVCPSCASSGHLSDSRNQLSSSYTLLQAGAIFVLGPRSVRQIFSVSAAKRRWFWPPTCMYARI